MRRIRRRWPRIAKVTMLRSPPFRGARGANFSGTGFWGCEIPWSTLPTVFSSPSRFAIVAVVT
jgi:hypothetical protein